MFLYTEHQILYTPIKINEVCIPSISGKYRDSFNEYHHWKLRNTTYMSMNQQLVCYLVSSVMEEVVPKFLSSNISMLHPLCA